MGAHCHALENCPPAAVLAYNQALQAAVHSAGGRFNVSFGLHLDGTFWDACWPQVRDSRADYRGGVRALASGVRMNVGRGFGDNGVAVGCGTVGCIYTPPPPLIALQPKPVELWWLLTRVHQWV